MIFISVGTTKFSFHRMNDIVLAVSRNCPREQIIYQCGLTQFIPPSRRILVYPFLSFPQMQRYLRKARVVILQGGPATIFQALSYGIKPYVVPRRKKYYEHVNDHQVHYCKLLEQNKLINIIDADSIKNIGLVKTGRIKIPNKDATPLLRYLDIITT